jgi:hypothetical protein
MAVVVAYFEVLLGVVAVVALVTSDKLAEMRCLSTEAVPYLMRLVAGIPPRRPGFDPTSGDMGFVVDKVAREQIFSEYFNFPCQFPFH